jgi:hypothetical protein
MNICINKEYTAGHTENYDKIKRYNMETHQDNANASLPAVKQTPLIHATNTSLFAYYRHPSPSHIRSDNSVHMPEISMPLNAIV